MGDTQLFLLRVWQHLGQFRASVRGVVEEEPRLFTEAGQLTEFLVQISAAAQASHHQGLDGRINPGEST